MSIQLFEYVTDFIKNVSPPEPFVEQYITRWRAERDNGTMLTDQPNISEALSSIFCITDLFNPNNDREEYEFDEPRLRHEIQKILSNCQI